jgi:conjugal transfer/entry exclusion protein
MTRKHMLVFMLMVGLVLGGGRSTSAQVVAPLPVIDVANLAQNIAQWVQLVLQVANQVLELTPVDEIILSGEFTSTLDELSVIITEAVGLSYDIGSLNAQISVLFDLDTAPDSMTLLKERLAEIKRVAWDGHVYALRTQTLVRTTLSAIQHLLRLVAAIGSVIGNMQANQTMTQVQSTVAELLAKIQVQMATYDRSRSVEHITEVMTLESLRRIHAQIMADHPVR